MSNRIYEPDKWVMVKITSKEHGVIYKVMASWYGGFAGSNSWKLSSGTIKAEFDTEFNRYHFHQVTDSVYSCHKNTYGMSMYTQGILSTWQESLEGTDRTIEVLEENFDIDSLEYIVV